MNKRVLALAGTAVIGLGIFGFGSPAMAASSSCTTLPVNPTCTTGAIPANTSGHFIDYSGQSSILDINVKSYSVKDLTTGVIVRQGTFTYRTSGRINGLYGTRYQMTLRCVCLATATIDNT